MAHFEGEQDLTLTAQFWAIPAEGKTIDDLLEEFAGNGNPVQEVDRENNRILMQTVVQKGLLG